ncbi:MAG: NYN domain-containing protein [Sporichthyaceae bacterium]
MSAEPHPDEPHPDERHHGRPHEDEPGAAGSSGQPDPAWDGPLPDAVRSRVVALAADTLGGLADDEVPAALKRFRSWAPQHRRTRAATPLAVAVERDVLFRQRVATAARAALPDLAAALDAGSPPPAADPAEVAAVAYLARTPGWAALVGAAAAAAERATADQGSALAAAEVARLAEQLAAERGRHQEQLAAMAAQVEAAAAAAAAVSRALREEKGARRRAERVAAEAEQTVAAADARAAEAGVAAQTEVARAAARVTEVEAALEASRRAVREGRSLEDTRVRLLLDTVVDAASALRRELALPPVETRPADLVDAAAPGSAVSSVGERALRSDDPAMLDQLLALPQAHLVVDGYNVTKTGYPELSLENQRNRLLLGLSHLAARSGAEVTCCFDGAALEGRVPAAGARGVRVLFSKPGETADELIRRLVRAEPEGRPVCVVSSDREVADGVRRSGARAVSSAALVRRLDRG